MQRRIVTGLNSISLILLGPCEGIKFLSFHCIISPDALAGMYHTPYIREFMRCIYVTPIMRLVIQYDDFNSDIYLWLTNLH